MTHQKLYLYTKYISTTYFSKLLFVNVVSCQVSTWLKLNVSHNPKLESGAQRKKDQQILLLDHDLIAKNELKQWAKQIPICPIWFVPLYQQIFGNFDLLLYLRNSWIIFFLWATLPNFGAHIIKESVVYVPSLIHRYITEKNA